MRTTYFQLLCLVLIPTGIFAQTTAVTLNTKDDGYRGIWYSNQPSNDPYVYKYSGGLATYPANHYPFSVYAKAVDKTFFCYGGTDPGSKTLLHMVSYFDHMTGKVPRPTIVLDKKTNDAHDNPVMNIDQDGFIWIFSTSHGTSSPSFIHRSKKPYDVDAFEQIFASRKTADGTTPLNNFSYLQSWYVNGKGFLNLFTHYDRDVIAGQPTKPRRTISFMTSPDGVAYSEWRDLATIGEGHYQTSGSFQDKKIATTFNFHPIKRGENGLNYRTNLYYIQTQDFGKTWQTAEGKTISTPLKEVTNAAIVHDYRSEGKNVYINDLAFDPEGNPVILFITSNGFQPGPQGGPRQWNTARFDGKKWTVLPVTLSDHNYDMGSLYIDSKGVWRIIGPTIAGAVPHSTGGEMVLWTSTDRGRIWKPKQLTFSSAHNHSYARRPVSVHSDFYAFWADGDALKKSASNLYFCDKKGKVYLLPPRMVENFARPIPFTPTARPKGRPSKSADSTSTEKY